LNARNPFETETVRPILQRYRAGVALGGPIVKDKTFFYTGFEQEHNRSQEDSFITPALESAVNRILAGGAYPGLATRRVTDGFFPVSRAETEASVKLNHQLTATNSLMLRYAFTNNREAGDAFNTAGWTDPSARGSSFTRDHALVGALTTIFDSRSVGDLRFQFADRNELLRTNDAEGPGITIAGLLQFGRLYDGNGARGTIKSPTRTHAAWGITSGKVASLSTMSMNRRRWRMDSGGLTSSPTWPILQPDAPTNSDRHLVQLGRTSVLPTSAPSSQTGGPSRIG
jgi:hypothetical protein